MKMRKSDWLKIGIVLVVFIIGLTFSYQILKPKPRLPIYNPSELDSRLVDESVQRQGRGHRVLPFKLANQFGDTITEKNLEGKIYIADFFFTTCPGICKDMAIEKRRLQEVFKADDDVVIVSHSVTPEMDSVPIMHEYGEMQGAIEGKWQLLTGDKPQIYKLARQSYFAVMDEGGNGDEDDFIHTENFVLVDPQKRIRGFYDGTSAEAVDKLIADIAILKASLNE
ncbi:SCO family protein [Owenweeksia hongkongensis]|uniref:SCO family protein n=1 Tax=Owenweeksia hongkongensis TaxID=253245 RepID=UPI003A9050CE